MTGVFWRRRAPLTALTVALTLAGCSGYQPPQSVRHGGTLVMSLYATPASLNPLVAGDVNSVRAYTPLFPHLYSVNADLSVSPDLASAMPAESNDGTVWMVPLRANAVWSDGKPIAAEDVVYTVVTESLTTLDTQATFDWSEVRSISAVSSHVVKFTLTHADASFLADHLTASIVPKHALRDTHAEVMSQSTFNQRPSVTGGPFLFDRILSPTTYMFAANPSYYLGRPNLDYLIERVVTDPTLLAGQLAQGQVLWAPGLTSAQAADARSDTGVDVRSYPALGYYAVQFNTRAGHLFADVALRHALDLAIDKAGVVRDSTAGLGVELWGDISPASWAYDPLAVPAHGRDVRAATALLTGAGWSVPAAGVARRADATLGAPLIYPRSDPARATAAQRIAAQAAAAGFALRPTALGDTDYGAALAAGGFEVALTAGGLGADPDDAPTLACDQVPPHNPTGLNAGGFCDPALDALLHTEQAVAVTSTEAMQAARRPVFNRIEKLLAADLPLIPLWTDTRWIAINSTVGGVGAIGPQFDEDLNSAFYAGWYLSA